MVYVTIMSNCRQVLGTLAFYAIPATATLHFICSPANIVSFDTARAISLSIKANTASGCIGGILWEREGEAAQAEEPSHRYWLAEGRY